MRGRGERAQLPVYERPSWSIILPRSKCEYNETQGIGHGVLDMWKFVEVGLREKLMPSRNSTQQRIGSGPGVSLVPF